MIAKWKTKPTVEVEFLLTTAWCVAILIWIRWNKYICFRLKCVRDEYLCGCVCIFESWMLLSFEFNVNTFIYLFIFHLFHTTYYILEIFAINQFVYENVSDKLNQSTIAWATIIAYKMRNSVVRMVFVCILLYVLIVFYSSEHSVWGESIGLPVCWILKMIWNSLIILSLILKFI